MTIGEGTVTTYTFGQDLYDDMLAAIDGAEHRILFESYIWKGDATGERFKQALSRAAGRGVEVYAVYDGFANLVVSPLFKRFGPRLKVLEYPVYNAGWRFFDLRRYGRDHRKILVVDDQVGFVGGYNIGSPYATEWRDTHVPDHRPRRVGPGPHLRGLLEPQPAAAARRPAAAAGDRRRLGAPDPGAPQRAAAMDVPDPVDVPRGDRPGLAPHLDDARLLHPGPRLRRRDQGRRAARRRRAAAAAGHSNHVVADWLSRGYYGEMLAAGVRIFRFQGAMVHAKTSTIDGRWSTVGTANIDRLSMTGNYEVNVEFIDASMAEPDGADLRDRPDQLRRADRRRPGRPAAIHKKFTELVLAPLRPLL